jgi:transglutaminase-like putative cysteine protease
MKHMDKYLASSDVINWEHPDILAKAGELSGESNDSTMVAKACFEYVRDEIKHSGDFELNPVTCRASDVLKHKTGYCYARTHLLAALLRANKIPAGLCYQRLTIADNKPPFCLHGLNAVYLPEYGWYRVDARGNKSGVDTAFSPPIEKLAYSVTTEGEANLPEIWPQPIPDVVRVLEGSSDYLEVAENLPDIELLSIAEPGELS